MLPQCHSAMGMLPQTATACSCLGLTPVWLLSCADIHGCGFIDDLMAIIQAAKRASLHSKLLMLMLACYSNMVLVVRAPSRGSRGQGSAVTAERTLCGGVAKTPHHLYQLEWGKRLGIRT